MPDIDFYSESINAPQDKIIAAFLDFEHYPEWQSLVLACTVKERDDEGRGALVEMYVDAKVKKIRYTTRYFYDLDNGRLGFDLVEGDLRACRGRYRLAAQADGSTVVSIDVTTDVGFFIPGPIKKLIRDQSLRNSMRDLRLRVGG